MKSIIQVLSPKINLRNVSVRYVSQIVSSCVDVTTLGFVAISQNATTFKLHYVLFCIGLIIK